MTFQIHFKIVDVMVLNDIIEQAAGRHSRGSDQGGEMDEHLFLTYSLLNDLNFYETKIFLL